MDRIWQQFLHVRLTGEEQPSQASPRPVITMSFQAHWGEPVEHPEGVLLMTRDITIDREELSEADAARLEDRLAFVLRVLLETWTPRPKQGRPVSPCDLHTVLTSERTKQDATRRVVHALEELERSVAIACAFDQPILLSDERKRSGEGQA